MPRVDAESVQDPEQIYLAASLGTARRVEALLNSHVIDYVAKVEELGRTTLFGSIRQGVAFYVERTQAEDCRRLLSDANLARGIMEREHPDALSLHPPPVADEDDV